MKLFEQLREIVGNEYFIDEQEALESYNLGTFPVKHKSVAVVLPASNDEIIALLKAVNNFNSEVSEGERVSVYPTSSGKNWGYSSQEPSCDNAILLKLERIKVIEDYNDKQGSITVTPGVTQQELYDYLQAQGGKFWMDATGASIHCSIIGNTMERGFGHTPYGDHFDNVCGLEVILPTGEVIETGFKQFSVDGVKPVAQHAYKWGVGAYIDGLFTQSNFGIVTKMTLWLMPKPEHFEAFFVSISDPEKFGDLIDAIQPLKLKGVLKSSAHIGNDHKAIQALSFYPWELTNGQTPLPDSVKAQLKKRFMLKAWSVSGAFYGSKAEVRVWKKMLKDAVKPVTRDVVFIDEFRLSFLTKIKSFLTKVSGIDFDTNLSLLKKVFQLKQGQPTNYFLPSTYWRKPKAPVLSDTLDPTKDNVGLLWIAPIAPIDGEHIQRMVTITQDIQREYGFEPGLSVTLLTARTLDCVVSLVYDRDVEGEDKRATECHDALFTALTREGYFPYRLSSHAHDVFSQVDSSLIPTLKTIKRAIDPNGLLAPDKYGV